MNKLTLDVGDSRYLDPHMMKDFLLPVKEDEEEGKLVVQTTISDREALFMHEQRPDYLARVWRDMYITLLTRIARITIGREEHFIIKFHPLVDYRRGDHWMSSLRLSADVMVAQTKNVVIPTIKWETIDGVYQPKEWKCGYCRVPNVMEDRSCEKCGAPRATLIQEL